MIAVAMNAIRQTSPSVPAKSWHALDWTAF